MGSSLSRTALAERNFRRILMIKPTATGDVLHAVPVLVKLRRRYPTARIDWLVTPENAPLVACHGDLSGVVIFQRRGPRGPGGLWSAAAAVASLLADLWRTRYDLVIDLQGLARSAAFTLATAAPVRLGFAHAAEGAWLAYTHAVTVPDPAAHAVRRNLAVCAPLGLDDTPPDLRLTLPAAAHQYAAELAATVRASRPADPLALVAPGTIWPTKHWTLQGFAEVCRALVSAGWHVALVGSPAETALCERLASLAHGVANLAGRTSLAELGALMAIADACLTNDSGPMHLAVAMDRPVAAVFGPTDPARTGPYNRWPSAVVRADDLACSPCFLRRLEHCRFEHACMTGVSASRVLAALASVLPDHLAARVPLR